MGEFFNNVGADISKITEFMRKLVPSNHIRWSIDIDIQNCEIHFQHKLHKKCHFTIDILNNWNYFEKLSTMKDNHGVYYINITDHKVNSNNPEIIKEYNASCRNTWNWLRERYDKNLIAFVDITGYWATQFNIAVIGDGTSAMRVTNIIYREP